MTARPHLQRLAEWAGIVPSWKDVDGRAHEVRDDVKVEILTRLGIRASTEQACEDEWRRRRDDAHSPAEVIAHGTRRARTLTLPGSPARAARPRPGRVTWSAEDEESFTVDVDWRASRGGWRTELPRNPPLGSARIRLEIGEREAESHELVRLIVPRTCWTLDEALGEGRRARGLCTNTYALRSGDDWGCGDLSVLRELVDVAASHDARFVGLSPLHLIRARATDVSPYSPVSRLLRNDLLIDVTSVPEWHEDVGARRVPDAATLAALRASRYVDYPRVAAVKRAALQALFVSFEERHLAHDTPRARAWNAFVTDGGASLRRLATFVAIEREHGVDRERWPAALRDSTSEAVVAWGREHIRDVDSVLWVQFEADRQLGALATRADDRGLTLGLYPDLAIGTSPDGADSWAWPHIFRDALRLGAPPDDFNADGQDWNLPVIDPRALAADGWSYWIALLRSAMRHAGMLRLDHILGLVRQWWIPSGASPTRGAYVRFPTRELLGVLALESRRQKTVIVGEDLGTVPDSLPGLLARHGILSSRVLMFGRHASGSFRPLRTYARRCLLTANTHDLPPHAGWLAGADVDLRETLGLARCPLAKLTPSVDASGSPCSGRCSRSTRSRTRDRRRPATWMPARRCAARSTRCCPARRAD